MIHRTVLIALILLAGTTSAAAQDAWQHHIMAGEYAFARGDVERAESEFRSALELVQQEPPGSRRFEASLTNLALLYEHEMRVDEAQSLYQLLLAAQEERLGEDDPALLDTLAAVGRVSLQTRDTPAAEESFSRYVELADASAAADVGQHWRVLSMLARMFTITERGTEALPLQRRAVEVLNDDAGATESERAGELESLAQLELNHGSADSAEPLLLEAAELRASDSEEAGIAEMLAAGAATALAAAEPEVAGRLAERALAASEAEGGAGALTATKVLADVAWLGVRRGGDLADMIGAGDGDPKVATAAGQLQQLVVLQQAAGAGDEALAETFDRLARVSALGGDAAAAATWQARSLDALRNMPNADPARIAAARSDQVALLVAAGDTNRAAAVNQELIAEIEADYGENDRRLVAPLRRQIELLEGGGRKKEAKAIKKRLKKLEKSLG